MGKVIVHNFYAGGKNVWRAEWYQAYSEEELKEIAEDIKDNGYGEVDTVTDSTGRLVKLS